MNYIKNEILFLKLKKIKINKLIKTAFTIKLKFNYGTLL